MLKVRFCTAQELAISFTESECYKKILQDTRRTSISLPKIMSCICSCIKECKRREVTFNIRECSIGCIFLIDFLPCVFGSVRAPTAQDFVRNSRRGMNFELKLGGTARLVGVLNVLKGQNGDAHQNLRLLGDLLLRVAR